MAGKKKSSMPSKESQPRGKNYEKNQKKKQKRKAAKAATGKAPAKKEEAKIAKAVEAKVERKEKTKPKAGNVGYLGVFDGTKGRSRRKNIVETVHMGPDEAVSIYEGDWQGETCKTDGSGQNIFSGTGDIVFINPKSLGPSIENEGKNWRYYEIEELDLWIEPLQGVTNTPGNIATAIETDPEYFASSGATLDFDTVNSYRPHVDHPVYCQDKPQVLRYRRKQQKTAASNQMYYTYFDPTQYATSSDQKTTTGQIDANVRQCFQMALISYCKACTASTELGVWQMRVKMRWRGNKKTADLVGSDAEALANSIINQNNKTYVEQIAEYTRRIASGDRVQRPMFYPNPRQVDTMRVMLYSYNRTYKQTRDLSFLRKAEVCQSSVDLYDKIKRVLLRNATMLNDVARLPPLRPADVTNPVSAMPVVIVDPSLATDSRLAANSKAAKVASDGTLQTTGVASGLNVNISAVGGTVVGSGTLPAFLVNGSGQGLTTFTDSGGQHLLGTVPMVNFVTDSTASSFDYKSMGAVRADMKDSQGNTITQYTTIPVSMETDGNYDGYPLGRAAGTRGMPTDLTKVNGSVLNSGYVATGTLPVSVLGPAGNQAALVNAAGGLSVDTTAIGGTAVNTLGSVTASGAMPMVLLNSAGSTTATVTTGGVLATSLRDLNTPSQSALVSTAGSLHTVSVTAASSTDSVSQSISSGVGLPVIDEKRGRTAADAAPAASIRTRSADAVRQLTTGGKPIVVYKFSCPDCKTDVIAMKGDPVICSQCKKEMSTASKPIGVVSSVRSQIASNATDQDVPVK